MARWILPALMLMLGVAHSFIAIYCKEFNEDTLWFLGSGIAIILAALFNVLNLLVISSVNRNMTIVVNVIISALFVVALFVLSDGQVYFGLGLFAVQTAILVTKKQSVFNKFPDSNSRLQR